MWCSPIKIVCLDHRLTEQALVGSRSLRVNQPSKLVSRGDSLEIAAGDGGRRQQGSVGCKTRASAVFSKQGISPSIMERINLSKLNLHHPSVELFTLVLGSARCAGPRQDEPSGSSPEIPNRRGQTSQTGERQSSRFPVPDAVVWCC